jgi:hypothetical protein
MHGVDKKPRPEGSHRRCIQAKQMPPLRKMVKTVSQSSVYESGWLGEINEVKLCSLTSYVPGGNVDRTQTLALAAELRVAIGNLKRRFRDQAGSGDLT